MFKFIEILCLFIVEMVHNWIPSLLRFFYYIYIYYGDNYYSFTWVYTSEMPKNSIIVGDFFFFLMFLATFSRLILFMSVCQIVTGHATKVFK